MIDKLQELTAGAVDSVFINYLYWEQKPLLRDFLGKNLNGALTPTKKILPSSYFCPGKENGHFQIQPRGERDRYKMFSFSFPSHRPSEDEENNWVRGKLFLLPRNAPCVLYLHGWRMRTYLSLHYLVRPFLFAGFHAAFMELPYHFSRAPRGTFSGQKMIEPDISITIRNMRQAVCDVRDTIKHLKDVPSITKIALVGVSLGGWVTALTCTAEKNLEAAVLINPPADPIQMYYRSDLIKVLKKGIQNVDEYFERNKKVLLFFQAFAHEPLLPKEKILIVEALYDRFVPKEVVEKLWRGWGKPPIQRYRHGHISIMLDEEVQKNIISFLKEAFG